MFTQVWGKKFEALYPGHPKLDAYIFGGNGSAASLKQVGSTPQESMTASLKASLAPTLQGPPQGFQF